jgi:hypothetical protein
MEKSFNTLAELQTEIGILKVKRYQQESAIKEKLNGPVAVFKSIASLFKTAPGERSFLEELLGQDIITNISRFLLPIMLNSSIFKHSGFFTKTIVALFSQKAAKKINNDTVLSLVDKIKKMLNKGKGLKEIKDYGIPPDSETY